MFSWEEIVEKYITRHSDAIQKATAPLYNHFGISYFTYHKIDLQGRYTVLVDQPKWAEKYVSHKLYALDPYLRHPDNFSTGFTFIDMHGSPEYQQLALHLGADVLEADLGAMYIKKSSTHVEFFGFSGQHRNSALRELYRPALMESFATHFLSSLKPQLVQMEREPIFLPHLKGEDFYTEELIQPSFDPTAFLQDIGAHPRLLALSPREKDCLRELRSGKSIKRIAAALDLSPRTVEFYLENMKDKLGLYSKEELTSLAQEAQALGLLPGFSR